MDLLACCKIMFDQWHRVRDGTLERADFQHLMGPMRGEILLLPPGALVESSPTVG